MTIVDFYATILTNLKTVKTPNFLTAAAVAILSIAVLTVQAQHNTFETNDPEAAKRYAELAKTRGVQVDVNVTNDDGSAASITLVNNRRRIQQGGKWGYADSTGAIVIPCTYDYASDFKGRRAMVGKNNPANSEVPYHQWHIDENGKAIYATNLYCNVYNFINGYAVVNVTTGYKKCHIKPDGKPLYAERYTDCWDFNPKGRALVEKANPEAGTVRYLVIDRTGKILTFKNYKFSESRSDANFLSRVKADLAAYLEP